jgi:hypothetical protein
MKPRFIVDTSHGVHMDGKGQLGLIIMLGVAVIFCRSCKLKAVTLSSTESEVYGLSDSVGYALWFARLLNDFGYSDVCPMETWQDNQSAMHMQTTGSGQFSRSKHIFIRDCFVKEHIDNGEIVLKYVPRYAGRHAHQAAGQGCVHSTGETDVHGCVRRRNWIVHSGLGGCVGEWVIRPVI